MKQNSDTNKTCSLHLDSPKAGPGQWDGKPCPAPAALPTAVREQGKTGSRKKQPGEEGVVPHLVLPSGAQVPLQVAQVLAWDQA